MKDYSPIYQRLFFVIFWVTMTFGFISEELLPPLVDWRSSVLLLTDALWVLLACITVRRTWHIVAIASFLVVSYLCTCIFNDLSVVFWANGLRDFLGLMLAYPVVCYFMSDESRRERFVPSLDRQLLIFLVIQAFCVTYQFLLYGAGDHGGGSLGNNGSGQISTIIYIVSYYLLHKRLDTDHFFASLNENKLLIFLLFPTFLNETKISFLLIIIYFVLLLPLDRRFLVRAMWAIPIVLGLVWVGAGVYTMVVRNSGEDITSMEYLTQYLSIDDIDEAEQGALWDIEQGNKADVPRLAKLMYLPLLHTLEPGHEVVGFGLGQFKGGTQLDVSDFADRYDWLLMGSIPYLFHVHIQLGLVGIACLFAWLLALFIIKPSWSTGRDLNIQMFVALVILMVMFYNDMLRALTFSMIFYTFFTASWLPQSETGEDLEGEAN